MGIFVIGAKDHVTNGSLIVKEVNLLLYMNKIKQITKRITKSHDGKTVFTNFGYLSLLQIASYVFPLITMPYLARVIGAVGFGKIAFASAIVVWIQTIADWGFNLTATRDVAKNRDNRDEVSRIFSNVLWSRCILTFASGILLLIAIELVPYLRENAAVIFITYLLVPGHILFPDWFFQAIEKMKYITIFNIITKLFFTIAVFIFIKEKEDYIMQPVLTTLGYIVCGIGALYIIIKKWGYTINKPMWKEIFLTIKNSTDVFVNNLMPNLYNSFSIMLLGFFGGSFANGLYDGGNKFPTIFYNFQSVLSRAFYPFLSRRPDKHRLFATLSMSVAAVMSLALIVLAPKIIILMLGKEFEGAIIVMQILSLSFIFLAMDYTYGTCGLIINHKEKPLRNLTFISSTIGMLLAIPLVINFHEIGAALTVLLCRSMLGVGSFILVKQYKL